MTKRKSLEDSPDRTMETPIRAVAMAKRKKLGYLLEDCPVNSTVSSLSRRSSIRPAKAMESPDEYVAMAKRKRLEHLLKDSPSNSTASSPHRRSNIRPPPVIEIAANDDESERRSLRLGTITPALPSNRRSTIFEVTSQMSSPQIKQGIEECIKLNTLNKINMKNAFSLNMIDYMSWMVKNRKDALTNLQVAAAGLDASAKIYAMRVDRLHHDILMMAANLAPADEKPKEENGNENAADPEASEGAASQTVRQKKRKKNMNILTTMGALKGEIETLSLAPVMFGESDCQTSDTLYQVMLPQHCSERLVLHAYNDVIVDEPITKASRNRTKRAWPPIHANNNNEVYTMFATYDFLNWSSEQEENSSSHTQVSDTDQLAFDLDAFLPPDNMPTEDNFYEMADDCESEKVCHAEARGPIKIATLENIIDAIPSRRLEYSLFDTTLDIRWAGPSHWKIKEFGRTMVSKTDETCNQNLMKKKKELTLEYGEDIIKKIYKKFTVAPKSKTKLKPTTVKYSWSENKILLKEEPSDNELEEMNRFYLRPDETLDFPTSTNANTTGLDVDDDDEGYNYDNPHDSMDYCPNIQSDISVDNENLNQNIPNGFVGTNLVEAPPLTQKVFIPYSQKAKTLNMRNLNNCIWRILITDEENKEMENSNGDEASKIIGEKSFVNVYKKIPAKLNKKDAAELSLPIAFVSLLHIANKQCLKIVANDDHSDVIIKQGAQPNIVDQ